MSDLELSESKSIFKKIIKENFLIYYLFSAFLIFLYSTQYNNYNHENYDNIGTIIFIGMFICLLIPVLKIFFDKLLFHYQNHYILYSFLLNVLFTSFVVLELIYIRSTGENYWYYHIDGIFYSWYFLVGAITFFYLFRRKISSAFNKVHKSVVSKFRKLTPVLKKSGYKITLIPFFLDWLTVKSLNKNYRAVYFTKKFIILQANPIKTTLPGLAPDNVSATMKDIFQADIGRMQQLFKYNHIRTYSNSGILKFVMKIANPIIEDLRITLEQYLTEELLKENNDSNELTINMEDLWKKVEKIMTNWESTFTENEFEYKDTLLHK